MLTSMTGFGRGAASEDGVEVTVEIRSVNSRYCEISVRGPRALATYEQDVQAAVRKRLERGRINVQVELSEPGSTTADLELNADVVRQYAALLVDLRQVAGIEEPVRLEHMLQFSDVFTSRGVDEEAETRRSRLTFAALESALRSIVEMRQQEGVALRRELEHRVDLIESSLALVDERAPARLGEVRMKLRERVAEILGDDRVDPDRIEQEIVMLADRLDVTEESVRLQSHIAMFREALAETDSVGRKLNFISQEMNREVNTIGSKANDPELARYVVTMKEELEKIREQIQNVE